MATDYDAPRRDEVELGEDSIEELKSRRADAQSGSVDVDETGSRGRLRAARGRPVRRGAQRQGAADAGRRVPVLALLPGAPPQSARRRTQRRPDLPRVRVTDHDATGRAEHDSAPAETPPAKASQPPAQAPDRPAGAADCRGRGCAAAWPDRAGRRGGQRRDRRRPGPTGRRRPGAGPTPAGARRDGRGPAQAWLRRLLQAEGRARLDRGHRRRRGPTDPGAELGDAAPALPRADRHGDRRPAGPQRRPYQCRHRRGRRRRLGAGVGGAAGPAHPAGAAGRGDRGRGGGGDQADRRAAGAVRAAVAGRADAAGRCRCCRRGPGGAG